MTKLKRTQHSFRVTSVKFCSATYTIFTGVPVDAKSHWRTAGTLTISLKAPLYELPCAPAIGQIWWVSGGSARSELVKGDYKLQQVTYQSTADNPVDTVLSLPEHGEELINFIANEPDFKGIGTAKARRLWESLGTKLHTVLGSDTPEHRKRLGVVLTEESIDALYTGYAKYSNLKYANWMSECKIPADIQRRLLKYHGTSTVDKLIANPYLLVGFGMPFKDVDAMALDKALLGDTPRLNALFESKFSVQPDDPRRLIAAVDAVMRKKITERGHTYAYASDIKKSVRDLVGYVGADVDPFELAQAHETFICRKVPGWKRSSTIHPTATLIMETTVAKRFLKLAASNNLFDEAANDAYIAAVADLPYELTPMQSEGVMASLDTAVSCITGGAGTGKTTVLRTVLRAYHELGFDIHAVALSGRAAMRLNESVEFPTKTIAKFLREDPLTDDRPTVLVIDEASMVDLPTMYKIVIHTNPHVRIIFTGDPDQLPPIGCGKVLADIVASRAIANTTLDIVKRQDGSTGIPEYSLSVNHGVVPQELTSGNITFHETHKDFIEKRCTELFSESPDNSRVIAATRAMVANINRSIQAAVNSDGKLMRFLIDGYLSYINFKQGDTILLTQNNYDKGFQNGSLGTLTSVEAEKDKFGEIELDTGETVEISHAVLDAMALGYAITLHKAQGSQFPRIIIALKKGRIIDRAWLYTAITRAEAEIHIVGSRADFGAVVRAESNAFERLSFLRELLEQGEKSERTA